MNSDPTQAWNTMVQDADNEFSNFLDFNDINIDFPTFENENQSQQGCSQPNGQSHAATRGGQETEMRGASGNLMVHEQGMMSGGAGPMDIQFGNPHASKSMMDLEHQARVQQQHQFYAQQHGHYQRQGVPPTPNSLEMIGGHPQFSGVNNPQQARAFYETYARKQQEQMFTPLVSPAVTPLDTQFNQMPEFARPGEYFSPLTSPALQAQHHSHSRSAYASLKSSDTSEAPSPVDMDIDSPVNMPGSAISTASSKSKRKPATKSTSRAVRQSPAMKPQRKKQPSSTVIAARDIADIMEGFSNSPTMTPNLGQPRSGRLRAPSSTTPSDTGSISPEPLSDVLMPPPATPRSGIARSPNMRPQDGQTPRSAPMKPIDNPATPASLMKLQKAKTGANGSMSNMRMSQTAAASGVGDIAIPHGSISKPDLSLDTAMADDDQVTPTLHARNGSVSAPLTAITPVPMSPSMAMSPNGRAGATSGLKIAKGKKRNSSSHASPALRPKISPSIKPLLPDGAKFTPETSALLLASKSNYQNILEGTHLPGVSYPEALSENLTSKRTSHKIAEQGRRNRINTALQEIAALLPQEIRSPSILAKDSASPNDGRNDGSAAGPDGKGKVKKERTGSTGGGVNASSSKANTVEQAIEYIKALQGELSDVKTKLADAERQLGVKTSSLSLQDAGTESTDSNGSKEVEEMATTEVEKSTEGITTPVGESQ